MSRRSGDIGSAKWREFWRMHRIVSELRRPYNEQNPRNRAFERGLALTYAKASAAAGASRSPRPACLCETGPTRRFGKTLQHRAERRRARRDPECLPTYNKNSGWYW